MKICIISSQIAGFGKIGGFASMTKQLALALIDAGCEVAVVVPKRKGQKKVDKIDGITIYGLSYGDFFNLSVYKSIKADIFHSQNPNLFSFIAQIAEPNKKHVITCRDPRSTKDWITEVTFATWKRRVMSIVAYLFEAGPWVKSAIKNADIVGVPAHYLQAKVERMYGCEQVVFLPNIEKIPLELSWSKKAKKPTICFVGRLDVRKRPELVFELAAQLPDYDFIIVGKAEEVERQRDLEAQALRHKNIKMVGFLDKFSNELQDIYQRSWILLNTSAREGLPLTFVEAAAYGCAIVSYVDPDNFASTFGYWAKNGDYELGLKYLVQNDHWRKSGQKGYEYVKETYSQKRATEEHLKIYKQLLNDS